MWLIESIDWSKGDHDQASTPNPRNIFLSCGDVLHTFLLELNWFLLLKLPQSHEMLRKLVVVYCQLLWSVASDVYFLFVSQDFVVGFINPSNRQKEVDGNFDSSFR
jgi:hypothetical protein